MTGLSSVWGGLTLAVALWFGGTPDPPTESAPTGGLGTPVEQGNSGREDRSVHTTAEDVLAALQKKRPANRVIEPASVLARGGVPVKQPLWPEGATLVKRSGRLVENGSWWTFVPDDDPDAARIRLLPNANLEVMVRSSKGAPSPLRFVVSGEMTVFQADNYLLPRFATRAADTPPVRTTAPPRDDRPSVPSDAHSESEEKGEVVAPDASVDDVLERLRAQRPTEEIISLAAVPAEARVDEAAPVGRAMLPDGTPLVERPGRLIADGDWWTLVFESDHPGYPEPPMKLLPNQNVELMVEASTRGQAGLVFIVSGEVTVFAGENHLLPRAARRRIDSGNLRK